MSNLELAALAFFKEKNIDYFLEKPYIKFSCLSCGSETFLNTKNTFWDCRHCKISGTLAKLIELERNTVARNKVYNPKKEKQKITKLFSELLERYDNDQKLVNLKSRTEDLIRYLDEKNTG